MTPGDEIEVETGNNVEGGKKKYEDKLKYVSVIAQPMASKKLYKKIVKLVKVAITSNKKNLHLGLKDVQNGIRKGATGLVVFAGDVTPVDVMCHLPAVCEEKNIAYCYIPSKQDLATAVSFHNSCLMVLIKPNEEYAKLYNEIEEEFKVLNLQNAEQYK